MPKIQVYDRPVYHPSGVDHTGADASLEQFAADLEWLASQGVTVERYNPHDHPEAFAGDIMAEEDSLPLILVDGSIASCGGYPVRQELAVLAGLGTRPRPVSDCPRSAFQVVRSKCCR